MGRRVLIVIPTYNEVGNLPRVVSAIFASAPHVNVLIVDDASPDGTGDAADRLASVDPRVSVLHRPGKSGLGAAYVSGFRWGLAHGYDVLAEMDADGSHPATTLPILIGSVGQDSVPGSVALVIGSRWMAGGSVVNWPRTRELLSRGGNAYARFALGIEVNDATAGFRAYRADALAAVDLTSVDSYGYCFQVDMTLRMIDAGYAVLEVPIVFRERVLGDSKMSRAIVIEAMWKVSVWGVRRRTRQLRAVRSARKRGQRAGRLAGRGDCCSRAFSRRMSR